MKTALRGTQVRHYHGIDLSQAALELAAANLADLPFKVDLDHRDFVEAMLRRPEHADAAWCSLSIHHLATDDKLNLMQAIRRATGSRGIFLLYEPTRRDGEDRPAWPEFAIIFLSPPACSSRRFRPQRRPSSRRRQSGAPPAWPTRSCCAAQRSPTRRVSPRAWRRKWTGSAHAAGHSSPSSELAASESRRPFTSARTGARRNAAWAARTRRAPPVRLPHAAGRAAAR